MTVGFPIVPIKLTLGREDQSKAPALPTDAKEVAIVCLSAALLFTSLAVVALATERQVVGFFRRFQGGCAWKHWPC